MNRIIQTAERLRASEAAFTCPICGNPMKVVGSRSFACTNKHSFDIAKYGYLNLLPRPIHTHYGKTMFEARHQMIASSSLFTALHMEIANAIAKRIELTAEPVMMADLGCGEGSHLHRILEACNSPSMIGVGLDISKEGILMASRRYDQSIWMIGDLAHSPFADRAFHAILNILSPSNYKEFKRIAAPGGLVVKVVPRPYYLKELRDVWFGSNGKKDYNNDGTVSLFKRHFQLVDSIPLTYTQRMTKTELEHLVQMTPLSWSVHEDRKAEDKVRSLDEITVDLDLLIGLNSRE